MGGLAVMMVLWGQVSPQLLRTIMEFFGKDLDNHKLGTPDTDPIRKFAAMGTSGRYPKTIRRDFKALLPDPKLPKLHDVLLPMVHNVLGMFRRNVLMILPHELSTAIYRHYPDIWTNIIYGSREHCKQFWHSVRRGQHFLQHPVRIRQDFETKCVPLKLHGDGTPVTGLGKSWGKLVDIFRSLRYWFMQLQSCITCWYSYWFKASNVYEMVITRRMCSTESWSGAFRFFGKERCLGSIGTTNPLMKKQAATMSWWLFHMPLGIDL